MTPEREDEDKPFLQRWSSRKREVTPQPGETPGVENPAETAAADGDPEAAEREQLLQKNRDEAEAIDLESLDETSDYSPFFRDGVPKALKSAAMRILWRSNPVFANLDGLNDYDQNFADPALIKKFTGTAWQIGKGYLRDEDELAEADPVPETGPAEAEDSSATETADLNPADDGGEAHSEGNGQPGDEATPEPERLSDDADEPDNVQSAEVAEAEEEADDPPRKVPLRKRLALDDWDAG
ncbi:MAG TPA: DUF3306 domain-containing protein [Afifellaceae bacterium]|nr:DUF3306 domain-containing protein [Afifellaceae bacterium]